MITSKMTQEEHIEQDYTLVTLFTLSKELGLSTKKGEIRIGLQKHRKLNAKKT